MEKTLFRMEVSLCRITVSHSVRDEIDFVWLIENENWPKSTDKKSIYRYQWRNNTWGGPEADCFWGPFSIFIEIIEDNFFKILLRFCSVFFFLFVRYSRPDRLADKLADWLFESIGFHKGNLNWTNRSKKNGIEPSYICMMFKFHLRNNYWKLWIVY